MVARAITGRKGVGLHYIENRTTPHWGWRTYSDERGETRLRRRFRDEDRL